MFAAVHRAGRAAIAEGAEEIERIGVAHRHDQKRRIVPREAELDLGDERKHGTTLVAADRALGIAGGAGGVHQRPWIAAGNRDIRSAVARLDDQIFIRAITEATERGAEKDEVVGRHQQFMAYALDARYQLVLYDKRAGLAVVHDVADFRSGEAEINRHRHQSVERGRGIDL